MLEYKSVPFEVKQVVDVSGGGWEVEGYASTFGGSPDWYGDVVAPGAFAESLARGLPKFLFEHLEPIGRTLEIREDEKGLFGRWSIVDTRAGTDAYKLAKAGVLDSLSIGFCPEEYAYRDDGVRVLLRVDLPEVSAVAIPANPNAVITDVKRQRGRGVRPFDEHSAYVQVAVRSWLDRVRSGSEQRSHEGRLLSDERKRLLADVGAELRAAGDELAALLAPPPPSEPIPDVDLEALRSRLAGLGVSFGGS